MVADAVSAIGDLTHQFGTSTGKTAHKEKCRGYPVAFQKTEELRRVRRIRPIIEGERDLRGIGGMVQGGTEKLRGRGYGAPSCNSCASSRGRRSIKRPPVHARIFACEASSRKSISCKKRAGISFRCKIASKSSLSREETCVLLVSFRRRAPPARATFPLRECSRQEAELET